MRAALNYLKKWGRPCEFYVDHGSAWCVNTNNKNHDKLTQFEIAVGELDIRVIHAGSPEAKGRVERSNKTLQDRLIKEMRLAGVSSMEEANRFAQEIYINDHNSRFAVKPLEEVDAHRSIKGFNLYDIMTIREERIVQNDYVVMYHTKLFQLRERQPVVIRPKDKIVVRLHVDHRISITAQGKRLAYDTILMRSVATVHQLAETAVIVSDNANKSRDRTYKPGPNHPWNKGSSSSKAQKINSGQVIEHSSVSNTR
jgi:hypothetical protein